MKNRGAKTKFWLAFVLILSLMLIIEICAMATANDNQGTDDVLKIVHPEKTNSTSQPEGAGEADDRNDQNPHGTLTLEEGQELEELYKSINEIYQEVFNGKEKDGLTNKEYKKRVAPHEKKLDAMEDRMIELEIKAGLWEQEKEEERVFETEYPQHKLFHDFAESFIGGILRTACCH